MVVAITKHNEGRQSMRAREFIIEGGWDTTVTQGTVITPSVVKKTLAVLQDFIAGFNQYLAKQGLDTVQIGRPTGSSAYYDVDTEDKIYGDIDLQMIGPEDDTRTLNQYAGYWNGLAQQYIEQTKPDSVHPTESKPGHPIVKIGDDQYVQIDFMWHKPSISSWAATRVTPERGIKGLLTGNMYSVLGELLDMSIQHAGVQYKTVDGERVPFSKQKGTEIVTVTTSPTTFIMDILKHLAKLNNMTKIKVDPLLKANQGVNISDVKIATLVKGVVGLARSLEANGLIQSSEQFINDFINRYTEKAEIDISSKKRDKAETPQAIERANADREKVRKGLDLVTNLFSEIR